jgi:hypothetical protein
VALLTGGTIDEIAPLVAAHHDADVEHVRADIETFASSLVEESLLVVVTDGAGVDAAAVALPAETQGSAWDEPEFERYTDMRDLLLFDPIHEVETTGWPAVKPPTE